MDIDVTQSSEVTVVAPKGDLDMAAADQVKRTLSGLIGQGQSRLVMDLGGVGYIDSSGMGVLVASMKQARAAGGDVRLCGLQEDVRAIFEMTRLIKAMSVHPTRQEALASLRWAAGCPPAPWRACPAAPHGPAPPRPGHWAGSRRGPSTTERRPR